MSASPPDRAGAPGRSGAPDEPSDPADRPWRLDAVVSGRVQGVGYRYYVIEEADLLGLTGWVANELDGSVRCVAEGPRRTLETLLSILHAGPPMARVDSVRETWSPATGGFGRFGLRSAGHRGD